METLTLNQKMEFVIDHCLSYIKLANRLKEIYYTTNPEKKKRAEMLADMLYEAIKN